MITIRFHNGWRVSYEAEPTTRVACAGYESDAIIAVSYKVQYLYSNIIWQQQEQQQQRIYFTHFA